MDLKLPEFHVLLGSPLILSRDFLFLLLQFVQQHGREFFISNTLDISEVISNHEFPINLSHLFGDQPILAGTHGIVLRLKGYRAQ